MLGALSLLIGLGVNAGILTVDNALLPPPLSVQNVLAVQVPYEEPKEATSTIEVPPEEPKHPLIREKTGNSVYYNCVQYLREKLGIPIKGDADKIIPNTPRAAPGIVILFQYGKLSHAALITRIENNIAYFKDTNRIAPGTPSIGWIDLNNLEQVKLIRGFFNPYL